MDCNQLLLLLLLLLNRSRNLLQRRLLVVNARARTNHGLALDSGLATVVTSTRPSLPVHDSPIWICCSRESNKSSHQFKLRFTLGWTKKIKRRQKKHVPDPYRLNITRREGGATSIQYILPVLMWMHQRMAVSPTPMTNEANAIPTVTSVETPTRITCWLPGCPLPVRSDPGDVVVSPAALISIETFPLFYSYWSSIHSRWKTYCFARRMWPWPPFAKDLEREFAAPSKPIHREKVSGRGGRCSIERDRYTAENQESNY